MFANFQIRDFKKKGKTAPQNPSYKVLFFLGGGKGVGGWGSRAITILFTQTQSQWDFYT